MFAKGKKKRTNQINNEIKKKKNKRIKISEIVPLTENLFWD